MWKVEKYRFPMWFVTVGPCSFWFRASSYECLLGVDLGVNLGVDRDMMNKKTLNQTSSASSVSFKD